MCFYVLILIYILQSFLIQFCSLFMESYQQIHYIGHYVLLQCFATKLYYNLIVKSMYRTRLAKNVRSTTYHPFVLSGRKVTICAEILHEARIFSSAKHSENDERSSSRTARVVTLTTPPRHLALAPLVRPSD